MVYRMADYYIMLERKYKLPVEQCVLFVGPDQPKMATRLARKRMQFEFTLIDFSQLDYELFIKSDKPEEILLAVLADFKGYSAANIVRQVVARIEETTRGDFSLKRYFQQLRVLSQLRNLESQIDKVMDSTADYIDEERDVLFVRGHRKAKEAGDRKFVTNLLTNTGMTVQQIATNAEVPVEFVLDIKAALAEKKQ